MFTDTHAHLCWPEFTAELPAVIERARAAGVERIVTIGTDLANCRQALAIAEQFPGVYAAVGLHPGDVPTVGLGQMDELRQLARQPKVVAIGETGLDYYRLPTTASGTLAPPSASGGATVSVAAVKQQQKDLLWAHLALAKELRLPVIIHNRDANVDLLEILCGHEPDFRPWGVMHCFSGDEKFAFDCIELGLFISFTGILTFKNAVPLRAVAKAVPLDHILLETDCPYLAPVPHRGQRNEPAYIPLIAQALAAIKGVPVEEVAAVTTRNAERLLHFPRTVL
jgi:TatD DNase family protein